MNENSTQDHFFDRLRGATETREQIDSTVSLQVDRDEDDDEEAMIPSTVASERIQGRLAPETRRSLIALLRHGVLMAEGKRELFGALCRQRDTIQEHLADMNLRLLLDEKAGLAILLQNDSEDGEDDESGSLITRRTLTVYDTLLLLVLRKHYQDRETAGEQRVIVDTEHIQTMLSPFLSLTNSSRNDRKKLNGALDTLKERRILAAVRGDEERYEITSVIRYVINAEFMEKMLAEYTELAKRMGSTMDPDSQDE